MLDVATTLSGSSTEALSATAAVLVAVALGFIIQGRIIDEHVHPPAGLRSRLVAVEILACGIFFVAAAIGVFGCLYYLTLDRVPTGSDRDIIQNALLTTAIVGFLFTIAGRAVPAWWPPPELRPDPDALSLGRWGVAVSVGLCLAAVPSALLMDTRTLLVFMVFLGAVLFVSMLAMSTLHVQFVERESLRALWLGRRTWTRVHIRAKAGAQLTAAGAMPPAFVPVAERAEDGKLWLSRPGLTRLWKVVEASDWPTERPTLHWVAHGDAEVQYRRPVADDRYVIDVVLIRRNDAQLYLVEPTLGLVEPVRATAKGVSPAHAVRDE